MKELFFYTLQFAGILALVIGTIVYFLIRKQTKFVNTLNEGDLVYYNGKKAEIIKKSDGMFYISLKTNGLDLCKFKQKKEKINYYHSGWCHF
jgi:hypothetical protein